FLPQTHLVRGGTHSAVGADPATGGGYLHGADQSERRPGGRGTQCHPVFAVGPSGQRPGDRPPVGLVLARDRSDAGDAPGPRRGRPDGVAQARGGSRSAARVPALSRRRGGGAGAVRGGSGGGRAGREDRPDPALRGEEQGGEAAAGGGVGAGTAG